MPDLRVSEARRQDVKQRPVQRRAVQAEVRLQDQVQGIFFLL
jgi:hypothetical protein